MAICMAFWAFISEVNLAWPDPWIESIARAAAIGLYVGASPAHFLQHN